MILYIMTAVMAYSNINIDQVCWNAIPAKNIMFTEFKL